MSAAENNHFIALNCVNVFVLLIPLLFFRCRIMYVV